MIKHIRKRKQTLHEPVIFFVEKFSKFLSSFKYWRRIDHKTDQVDIIIIHSMEWNETKPNQVR